jgi:hypothetical protein
MPCVYRWYPKKSSREFKRVQERERRERERVQESSRERERVQEREREFKRERERVQERVQERESSREFKREKHQRDNRDRATNRPTHITQTDIRGYIDRQTDRHIQTDRQTQTHRHKSTHIQTSSSGVEHLHKVTVVDVSQCRHNRTCTSGADTKSKVSTYSARKPRARMRGREGTKGYDAIVLASNTTHTAADTINEQLRTHDAEGETGSTTGKCTTPHILFSCEADIHRISGAERKAYCTKHNCGAGHHTCRLAQSNHTTFSYRVRQERERERR